MSGLPFSSVTTSGLTATFAGIIPFTSVATKDILSDRLGKEVDREEAMKRVQTHASLLSLTTVSDDLVKFLKSVQ